MSTKKQPAALRPCGPNLDPHQVIVAPLVTEKMNAMSESTRTYAFQVNPWATKPEIKRAAEILFGVSVAHVRTMNCRGKARAYRSRMGRLANWKKAYVTLDAESKPIELF
jgi:large subunit ribosomal protein L23